MEWSGVVGVVIAISAAIGLPFALRRRKKAGPQRREELYQHLQGMGVKAFLIGEGNDRGRIGLSRFSGQRSEGIIELRERGVDVINVVSVATQYGVSYFLDYLVKNPNVVGGRTLKKTRLVRKKSSSLGGKTVAIEWRGDNSLAQNLSYDRKLEDRLLQAGLDSFREGVWIFPETKYGYVRIRTPYLLPSRQMLEAVDIIARHVKSF